MTAQEIKCMQGNQPEFIQLLMLILSGVQGSDELQRKDLFVFRGHFRTASLTGSEMSALLEEKQQKYPDFL